MKLTFHGAARTVTGSKHLLSLDNGKKILLDCGMFQGMGSRTHSLNTHLGFDAADVSIVLLSHAHIDHSGLLPKLVKEGFKGKIYSTEATKELTEILLLDSAEIQQHDNGDGRDPLYNVSDVQETMSLFETIACGTWTELADDISVLFTRTGHLIGSVAIHLRITENGKTTSISFSADVGKARHALLQPAEPFPQSEYIILESTYGDSHHDVTANNIDMLLQWVKDTCVRKKGKLIIPAFSVGRTQELLFLLNQLDLEKRLPPDLKYFVDSPLSIKATTHMKKYTAEFNDRLQQVLKVDEDPFHFSGLRYVETSEDSMRLTEYDEPCVIISASGTADAGRVKRHIQHSVSDAKNSILISGYCGAESVGGTLLSGARTIELYGRSYDVKAKIGQLKGMSAHGDCNDLCQYLGCQEPGHVRAVFLVHGEHRVQQALADRLQRKDFYPVHIPEMHEEFILNRSQLALQFRNSGIGEKELLRKAV